MQLEPECIGCLFNQILRAFKLLDPMISRERILNAQKKLMEYLINLDFDKINSQYIQVRVALFNPRLNYIFH